MTLGMAGAGMIAPWLGAQLKPLDPALPFALSSLALAALVLPLAAAERAAGLKADAIEAVAPRPPLPAPVFFVLLLAAALGFQIFFNLGAAPAYLRHYSPGDLHWLMPMFWLGVAGGSVLASATAKRWPAEGVFAAGSLIAAAAALLFGMTTTPALLPLAQVLGGIGWGLALCKAFALAERYQPAPDSAAMLGGLQSYAAQVPAYKPRNDTLYTNRFGLDVSAKATQDVTVHARLAMYKTFGAGDDDAVTNEMHVRGYPDGD